MRERECKGKERQGRERQGLEREREREREGVKWYKTEVRIQGDTRQCEARAYVARG